MALPLAAKVPNLPPHPLRPLRPLPNPHPLRPDLSFFSTL